MAGQGPKKGRAIACQSKGGTPPNRAQNVNILSLTGIFFGNSLMPVGVEYGVVFPAGIGDPDTRSHRVHYVVTGHFMYLRFAGDKVGELGEGIKSTRMDRLSQSLYEPRWEPFCYWVLDD